MDYRLNNEAIASCVILKVLERCKCDTLRITLIVPLLMEGLSLKNTELTLRYRDYLPMVVNSMSLLMQMKCIQLCKDELSLTNKGNKICLEIDSLKYSKRLHSIVGRIDTLLKDVKDYSNDELYYNLKIIL